MTDPRHRAGPTTTPSAPFSVTGNTDQVDGLIVATATADGPDLVVVLEDAFDGARRLRLARGAGVNSDDHDGPTPAPR